MQNFKKTGTQTTQRKVLANTPATGQHTRLAKLFRNRKAIRINFTIFADTTANTQNNEKRKRDSY